jgi:hypothetical protein
MPGPFCSATGTHLRLSLFAGKNTGKQQVCESWEPITEDSKNTRQVKAAEMPSLP